MKTKKKATKEEIKKMAQYNPYVRAAVDIKKICDAEGCDVYTGARKWEAKIGATNLAHRDEFLKLMPPLTLNELITLLNS